MLFIYFKEDTMCPRSSDPFHMVTYYIKRVTTSWTDGRTKGESTVISSPRTGREGQAELKGKKNSCEHGSCSICFTLYVQEVVTHFIQ